MSRGYDGPEIDDFRGSSSGWGREADRGPSSDWNSRIALHNIHREEDRADRRDSAASIINEQTGNLKLAQKFLGHSTIEMTADVYTHTSAEAEREAAVALERAIYGELFPVVPNFANGNNSATLN